MPYSLAFIAFDWASFASTKPIFFEIHSFVSVSVSEPTPASAPSSAFRIAFVLKPPSSVRVLAKLWFVKPISFTEFVVSISAITAIPAIAAIKFSSELNFNALVANPPSVEFLNCLPCLIDALKIDVSEGEAVFLFLQEDSCDGATLLEYVPQLCLINLSMTILTSSGKKLTQTLEDGVSLQGLSPFVSLDFMGDLLVDRLSARINYYSYSNLRILFIGEFRIFGKQILKSQASARLLIKRSKLSGLQKPRNWFAQRISVTQNCRNLLWGLETASQK